MKKIKIKQKQKQKNERKQRKDEKGKKSRDCKGTINHIVPHINDISARHHFLNHQKAESGEKLPRLFPRLAMEI